MNPPYRRSARSADDISVYRDDIQDGPNARDDSINCRGYAAVAVVVVLLLISVVPVLRTRRPFLIDPDEARFQELRTALPGRGTVGYLSDFVGTTPYDLAQYYLTQYSLAPVVVTPRPDQRTVGNFSSLSAARALMEKHELDLVRDFGKGLLLLEKPAIGCPPYSSENMPQRALCAIEQIGDLKGAPLGMPTIEVTLKDNLTVTGWAVDGIQRTAAARVDVVIDRVPYAALYGGDRPEVANVFQNP